MNTVKVYYKGKKEELHLSMPWLTREYDFHGRGNPIPMNPSDAKMLLESNPNTFGLATGQKLVDAAAVELLEEDDNEPVAELSGDGVEGTEGVMPEPEEQEVEAKPKYISHMNKSELAEKAQEHGEVLDPSKPVKVLRKEVRAMETRAKEGKA